MSWSLVASTTAAPGSLGGTTSAINTIGANLIVAEVSCYSAVISPAFTDSSSNAWRSIGPATSGADEVILYYCVAPTTSVTHTFTFNEGGGSGACYPAINVTAWSGGAGTGSDDQTNNATGSSVATLATGSITPSVNGELVIAALGTDATTTGTSVSPGTLQLSQPYGAGNNLGGFLAYYEQGTAVAVDPAFSWTGSANAAAIVASFKPVSSGTTVTCDALLPTEALGTQRKDVPLLVESRSSVTNVTADQGPLLEAKTTVLRHD